VSSNIFQDIEIKWGESGWSFEIWFSHFSALDLAWLCRVFLQHIVGRVLTQIKLKQCFSWTDRIIWLRSFNFCPKVRYFRRIHIRHRCEFHLFEVIHDVTERHSMMGLFCPTLGSDLTRGQKNEFRNIQHSLTTENMGWPVKTGERIRRNEKRSLSSGKRFWCWYCASSENQWTVLPRLLMKEFQDCSVKYFVQNQRSSHSNYNPTECCRVSNVTDWSVWSAEIALQEQYQW
jgi:hypothetical protein